MKLLLGEWLWSLLTPHLDVLERSGGFAFGYNQKFMTITLTHIAFQVFK